VYCTLARKYVSAMVQRTQCNSGFQNPCACVPTLLAHISDYTVPLNILLLKLIPEWSSQKFTSYYENIQYVCGGETFLFCFIIISCAESGEAGACVTGNRQERLPTVLIHLEIMNISDTPLSFKTRWSQRFLTAHRAYKSSWLSIALIHLVITKTLTIHYLDLPGDREVSGPLYLLSSYAWRP
jgi:hypothetical protein